jgi:hypothetical protein
VTSAAVKAYSRCAFGVVVFALGLGWLLSIHHAQRRSSAIQHGQPVAAVVDDRRHTSSCFHFTCDQTVFTVRYIAAGRVWRSPVIVDGWDHAHPPGSLLPVVYDPAHPGRTEVKGRAPSAVAPTLGAWLCIVCGPVIALAWASVIRRRGVGI